MEDDICLLGELNSYYRTQMSIMSKYLQIVWNRFNWFTTLNIGLISFYATQDDREIIHSILPKIGIALAMAWLIVGLMDYVTVKKLNMKGKVIKDKIKKELALDSNEIIIKEKSIIEVIVDYIDSKVSQHFILYLLPSIILLAWLALYLF